MSPVELGEMAMFSNCNYFVSRIAGETRKNFFDRFCEAYNEVCERYPNAVERDTRDGFEVVEAGERVAYFSQVGFE